MKLQFLGATRTVTGSNYLIETETDKFIIDFGQYQGTMEEEKLNDDPLEFMPSSLDFMILTHAHIDHSGRIPLLVKEGFNKKVLMTKGTKALAEILLKDSGKIHEAENEWENRKRERAGLERTDPLFTEDDAIDAIQYFYPVDYDDIIEVSKNVKVRFVDSGHLLGAASVEVWVKENGKETKLVFSGDLGNGTSPLQKSPTLIKDADYVIMESTYGNREHESIEIRAKKLADILIKTYKKGGTSIIPAFAVGRTQEIIFELRQLSESDDQYSILKTIPIYLDSPLAIDATEIYRDNTEYLNETIQEMFNAGKSPISMKNLGFVQDNKASIALNFDHQPKVIISASGMCDAGRVKHHLKHNLWKSDTSVIFIGYQGEGTLGRLIKDGEEMVTIYKEDVKVSAEIHTVEGYSGHAGNAMLMRWIKAIEGVKTVFVTHGEIEASLNFKEQIEDTLNQKAVVPHLNDIIEL